MKELKGKQLSLRAKIAAVAYVVTMSVLTAVFGWSMTVWEHVQVGLFIAGVFGTIDLSLLAEAIKSGR